MSRDRDRTLLERCGIDPAGVDDEELAGRAARVREAVDAERGAHGEMLDEHLESEFAARDTDAAMATMAPDPYLLHVPTGTGGRGTEAVRRFYAEDFIPGWPEDTAVTPVQRTVGATTVVDELVVSFRHDREMPAIVPGVAPTGRRVDIPHAVVVGFSDEGKVAFERIYWDQATVLVQLGLLDPAGMPVTGAEQGAAVRALPPG